jgi:hypothetical protein
MVHLVIISISFEAKLRSQTYVLILYLALLNNIYAIIATWICYIFGDIGSTIMKTQLEQSWFPVMATLAPTNTCHFVTVFHER